MISVDWGSVKRMQSNLFVEQRLGLLQIRCVEALGEPPVDWREKSAGLIGPAVVAPDPGEADHGAQFQKARSLPSR